MRLSTAFVALAGLAALPAAAQDMKLLNSWDQNFPASKVAAQPFVALVNEAAKGSMKITIAGPETVPSFEQFQPLQSGAFQFLFTHAVYHYGVTGAAIMADAVKSDSKARRDSGFFAAVDKAYNALGVKLIAMPLHKEGYQIVLRKPMTAEGDLKGMKIRANAAYKPLLDQLGAVMVPLPPGEVYSALQKGVVDGAAWPTIGVISYRWYEVSSILVRPTYGNSTYMILANLEAWNKLGPDKQKIVNDAALKIEAEVPAKFTALTQDEEKELIGKGMKVVTVGAKHAPQLTKYLGEGLWGLADRKNPELAKQLRQLVKDKGLED